MGLFAGGFISVLWAIVRETTPARILGLTSGMLNPAPFLGVAAFQVLTGAILDHVGKAGGHYALSGFQRAFVMCLIANALCLGLCFFIRKPEPEA
jgi:MFS family permease